MDLIYAHQLLVAADQRGSGSFQITSYHGCRQARCMAAAGLVEISDQGSDAEPAVSIDRLTDLGHTFLRTFAAPPPLLLPLEGEERTPAEIPVDPSASVVARWRNKFVMMQTKEIR